jgi:hypothetical protein
MSTVQDQDQTAQQTKAAIKKKEARDRQIQEFISSLACKDIDPSQIVDRNWCTEYLHFIERELEKAQENELNTSPLKFVLGRYSYATCSSTSDLAVDEKSPEMSSCGLFFSSCVPKSKSDVPATQLDTIKSSATALSTAIIPPLIPGLWLEFGVAEGKTLGLIARHINRIKAEYAENNAANADRPRRQIPIADGVVYGFDSFEGLPEDWRPGFDKGHFCRNGGHGPDFPDEERESIQLVKGWFKDSLPGFLAKHPESVSLVHVDCDIYSGAKYVLKALLQECRLRRGTVVVFDELFNYCGFESHEFKALFELVHDCDFGLEYEWIGVEVKGNMRAAFVVTRIHE